MDKNLPKWFELLQWKGQKGATVNSFVAIIKLSIMHINISVYKQNKVNKKFQNVNAQFEEICKSDYRGPRTFESRMVFILSAVQ